MKRLQNIAYQLGQEETKEMTRGKYLNILRLISILFNEQYQNHHLQTLYIAPPGDFQSIQSCPLIAYGATSVSDMLGIMCCAKILQDIVREAVKYYFADFVRKGGGGGTP